MEDRATSFGAHADAYERARPPYPDAALRWCLPEGARAALDLGAGTGKLTRGLLALGLDVTAVEPLAEMRAHLPAAARALDGSAEAIPLPDAAVDAVFAGQAFHWFDRDRALAEVARVLRPGGTLGLLWNRLDDRVGWVAELSDVVKEAAHLTGAAAPYTQVPGLTEPEHREFEWGQEADADLVVDRIGTSSLVILMSGAERAAALARARAAVPPG
ncbi:MAG TPA: class I SAM-dependent methyltransferase, partial [Solirubrobacteraceae bacterium]